MTLNCSAEMVAKMEGVGDSPLYDSIFLKNLDGTHVEKTQGSKGIYISSEADGWQLRGPFQSAL